MRASLLRETREARGGTVRNLFFATDFHGSEKCFLKFLNVWKYHPVQVLVMGGDMTGKGFVPIIRDAKGRHKATLLGEEYSLTLESELQELEKNIRFNGFYPYRTTPEEIEALERDKTRQKVVFRELMVGQVARWEQMADDRLRGAGVSCYVIPGNDDIREIDVELDRGHSVVNIDGKVVEIAPDWVMLGAGYSNHTPWHGPREYDEEVITSRVDEMMTQVPQHSHVIFDFHCPPYGAGIDTVQLVDEDFRPRYEGVQPLMGPAGSRAVRDAIGRYRPLLGLHGHIHESRGVFRYKGATAINPGSEYASGILKGVIVSLGASKVDAHMFTES